MASWLDKDKPLKVLAAHVNAPISAQPRSRRPLRRAQLSDEVAGHLRAAIMSGTLRPGTFIRLDETAAELGVSITPVREALLKLRGEGMVQLEPHRGHVVLPLTRQDIDDIFWLQATIARELAASATDHITDAEIDELDHINDALAAAVGSGDRRDHRGDRVRVSSRLQPGQRADQVGVVPAERGALHAGAGVRRRPAVGCGRGR